MFFRECVAAAKPWLSFSRAFPVPRRAVLARLPGAAAALQSGPRASMVTALNSRVRKTS
jgi:hypothetical protein